IGAWSVCGAAASGLPDNELLLRDCKCFFDLNPAILRPPARRTRCRPLKLKTALNDRSHGRVDCALRCRQAAIGQPPCGTWSLSYWRGNRVLQGGEAFSPQFWCVGWGASTMIDNRHRDTWNSERSIAAILSCSA